MQPEAIQLRVGDGLAKNGNREQGNTGHIRIARKGGRVCRRKPNGKDEHEAGEGLDLQEQEQPEGEVRPPFPGKRGIARVVAAPERAPRDMSAEAQ